MVNEEKVNNWSYEHFMAYLFLYVADSDYNISQDEIRGIKQKLGRSLQDDNQVDKIISEVKDEIKNHGGRERDDYILNNAGKYLKSEEDKKKIMSDLEEVIKMDGQVDSIELLGFRFIRNALNGINLNI